MLVDSATHVHAQRVRVRATPVDSPHPPLTLARRYFLFNQFTTFASVFLSVHVYASAGLTHLPQRMLWVGAGSLFAAWALSYVV